MRKNIFSLITFVFLWAIFRQISLMIKCWIFRVSWVKCTGGAILSCSASPYFIPLLSVLFIRIGHDHMISIHISFLILHKRESNSNLIFVSKTRWWIFWFWFHQVLEYVETVHFKSFFCFPLAWPFRTEIDKVKFKIVLFA